MICPNCGEKVPRGAANCPTCGAILQSNDADTAKQPQVESSDDAPKFTVTYVDSMSYPGIPAKQPTETWRSPALLGFAAIMIIVAFVSVSLLLISRSGNSSHSAPIAVHLPTATSTLQLAATATATVTASPTAQPTATVEQTPSVTATATVMTTATSTSTPTATATLTPTPPKWLDADIGNPGRAGSSNSSPQGTITVNGGGGDIWNTSDSFHLRYLPLSGNQQIVARVVSIENTDTWAKAGVMIRNGLDANAAYAFTLISYSSGIDFQYRSTAGSSSAWPYSGPGNAPYWVKLTRVGTTISSFISADGTNWVPIGTTTLSLGNSAVIGLAVTAHNNAALNTSVFSSVQVTSLGS